MLFSRYDSNEWTHQSIRSKFKLVFVARSTAVSRPTTYACVKRSGNGRDGIHGGGIEHERLGLWVPAVPGRHGWGTRFFQYHLRIASLSQGASDFVWYRKGRRITIIRRRSKSTSQEFLFEILFVGCPNQGLQISSYLHLHRTWFRYKTLTLFRCCGTIKTRDRRYDISSKLISYRAIHVSFDGCLSPKFDERAIHLRR